MSNQIWTPEDQHTRGFFKLKTTCWRIEEVCKTSRLVEVKLGNAVYCTALREDTESDFDFTFKKFEFETVATEQTLLVMGCVKAPALVEKYFKIIISVVNLQDRSKALTALYNENVENAFPVFEWRCLKIGRNERFTTKYEGNRLCKGSMKFIKLNLESLLAH